MDQIDNRTRKQQIDQIDSYVCYEFGLTLYQLHSKSRKGDIPTARSMCWLLIKRRKFNMGLIAMGNLYNKHHATVIHGIKQLQGRMMWEKDLKRKYINILIKLGQTKALESYTKN